jgi:hypothetical protein
MKTKLLLFSGMIIFFCSCSSSHKLGQTPDDVYYSPAQPQDEYVSTSNQQEMDSYGYNNYSMYPNSLSFGLGYGSSPFLNYYGSPFFSPYNSFYSPYSPISSFFPNYDYYYDIYYYPIMRGIYGGPGLYNPTVGYKAATVIGLSNYSGPRQYNLAAYSSTVSTSAVRTVGQTANNTIIPGGNANTNRVNSNSGRSGVGNFLRRVFSLPADNNSLSNNNRGYNRQNSNTYYNNNNNYNNYNNSNNNFNNTPSRSFQQGSGNSGRGFSGSSSSGGSAPARTFRRQ